MRIQAVPSARLAPGLALTALLCGLLAWASLRWSPLPGRPLVDAAGGVALVAVLVLGWRAVPAVVLGLAVGRWLWASGMPACGHGNCDLALTASVHAVAAAVQAGLGAWLLVQRRDAWNQLDEPRDIWAFFLRAAALPSVAGVVITTTYHATFGGMPWSAAPAAGSSHWVGAVLGVMIGAPIALAWVAEPSQHWAPRRWSMALTGLTSVLLVHLGIAALAAADARRTQAEFGHSVKLALGLARNELQDTLQAVQAMKLLFAERAEVPANEFQAAALGWLPTAGDARTIGWAGCDRPTQPPAIRLLVPARGSAPDSEAWFRDTAVQVAVAKALRTGQPAVSAQIPLGAVGGGAGVAVLQPVPQAWHAAGGCGRGVRGLVFATLPLPRLAEALRPSVAPPLMLCLLDRSQPEGQQHLGEPGCESARAARRHLEPLVLGDRRWDLLVYDGSRSLVHDTAVVAGVATAGMAGAAALVVLLLTVTGRARRIEAAVAEVEAARRSAEAASLAKSSFLSRMSHELRTPLNAVLGFAQLLESAQAPALTTQHLRWALNIRRAGDHLLAMINDILDLSRIESDTLNLLIEPLAVEDLVAESVALVEQRAAQRSITIHTLLAPDAARLRGDATRVRQVLANLLSNAVKYNREGGEIRIVSSRVDGEVEIEVRDTGIGLSAAQLAQLYEPFNRLGRERGPVEGAGIGLVISRRLTLLMGGDLRVASEQDRGSAFTLVLPADDTA